MKILINYANYIFENSQKECSKSALNIGGFDRVIEYGPKDIDINFYKENKNILKNIIGNGYWLWKPYIILKTLLRDDIKIGDYVVYADSGSRFVGSINIFIDEMQHLNQDILLFSSSGQLSIKWVKRDIFIELDCDYPKYHNDIQLEGGFQIIKKSQFSIDFYKQLLNICTIPGLIDDSPSKAQNYKEFIENRHDQAILSLYYHKKNLKLSSLENSLVISVTRKKDRKHNIYIWLLNCYQLNPDNYKDTKLKFLVIIISKKIVNIFN